MKTMSFFVLVDILQLYLHTSLLFHVRKRLIGLHFHPSHPRIILADTFLVSFFGVNQK